MVKAIRNASVTLNVWCNPNQIALESHGNLHKAMNLMKLPINHTKVSEESSDDYEFQFFHSLGKFLYNKRKIYLGVDSSGNIRAMQFYELKNPINRPKLYFSPEDIINRAPCPPSYFWLYLEENFLDFSDEIDDVCENLEYFQLADLIGSQRLTDNFPLSEYIPSYLCGRAVLNYNIHPAPRKFFNITAPTVFSFTHRLEENKEKLLEKKPISASFPTFVIEIHGFGTEKITKIRQEQAEENELCEEIVLSLDNISV